jgi:hypothetical protein
VVEAKGPGGKLRVDQFAVRGAANGAVLTQMSENWVKGRIPRLATTYKPHPADAAGELRAAGEQHRRAGDRANGVATYELKGLVITANWDEITGEVGSSMSRRDDQF